MNPANGLILCLAYILGLLFTAVPWGGWIGLAIAICLALGIRRVCKTAPHPRIWLAAGAIALLASLYFQIRLPQPQATDISWLIPETEQPAQELTIQVQGQVTDLPRVTRSQKAQFWLDVQQVGQPQDRKTHKPATGKLYVTIPLLQATGLQPGQTVEVVGNLYKPKLAANPGGFDFQAYLAQEGCFAGLKGQQLELLKPSAGWGWWKIQQQIVRSQMQGLGSPEGPLVSAMVLGGRAVDLPYDVKDQFVQAGLAHALAASGFQTSLILGVILSLTSRWSERVQFVVGTTALVVFVGLTGLQPSVLRAALMGFGGLVALVMGRKVRPLGSLLVTATLLLLLNPLWIWSLSFQLSFLATMGLLVTVPPIAGMLDWIPSAIAPLIAVPMAAFVWTLPVQLYAFGVLSPYSLVVNILTTPFLSLLSIGGMASALAAVLWSPAGSALAWLLEYPTQGLLILVTFFTQLPAHTYAVGTISVLVAIALYTLIGLAWLQPWCQKHWWVMLMLGVMLVIVPAGFIKSSLFRLTVLATTGQPVLVIQDGNQIGLVNSGDAAAVNFTILPFLQKEGINQVDWAIAVDPEGLGAGGWNNLQERVPTKRMYAIAPEVPNKKSPAHQPLKKQSYLPLTSGQSIQLGTTKFRLISQDPLVAELQMPNYTWVWLGPASVAQQSQLVKTGGLPDAQVLWWPGKQLHAGLVAALKPQVAIASANTVHPKTMDQLRKSQIKLYWTGQDGAVQWTPTEKFKTILESGENKTSPL